MTKVPPASPALSALYGVIAMAMLTVMDAFIKAVSGPFSAVQILWLRFALTAIMAAALLALWRIPLPARTTLPQHLVRAVLMIVSNGLFIYALGLLPLAEVFALALTAPLFLAALGVLILGERFTLATAVGLLLGFAGMVVIVFGSGQFGGTAAHPPFALFAALVSPITYAIGLVLLRQQATGEAPVQVVFVQAVIVTALVTPVAFLLPWSYSALAHWPTILAIGALSTAAYLVLTKALAGLTAVRYSVIEYTGLIWAALIGWLWFNERPTPSLWLGAGLIGAGALTTVLQREAAKT